MVQHDSPVATWTPNGGDPVNLSDAKDEGVMFGGVDDAGTVLGLDMPPEVIYESEFPGDGALYQGSRFAPAEVTLPIVIHADTLAGLEIHRRRLMSMFNPRRGVGEFNWALPDGSSRSLYCRYSEGLNEATTGRLGSGRGYFDTYGVVLRAHDPFWYGRRRVVSFRPPSEEASDPFLPGPPFRIAGPGPGGTRVVDIDSDVETSAVLRMAGPLSVASWLHEDLALELDLTPGLSAGQELVVRTGPRVDAQDRFVRDGVNVWGVVTGDFPPVATWVLQPGPNTITTQFSGVSAGSDAWIEYQTRYLTA